MRIFFLLFLSIFLSACTQQQEESLYQALNSFALWRADLEAKQAKIGELEMAYLENRTEGSTLLILHGFSARKESWLQFAAPLSDKLHLIIPDQIGHGDSSKNLDLDYKLEQQAQRLHQLMQHKGIKQFHILGNSMGGAIAAIYSVLYPQEILSLTLMNAAGAPDAKPSEFLNMLEQGKNPLISTDEASFDFKLDFVSHKPTYIPTPIKNVLIRQALNNEALYRKIFADMLASKKALIELNFAQKLKQLKMPALILWGDKDRVLDVSGAERFQHYLANNKVIIYPNVGHIPMIEIPEISARDVGNFINSITAQNQ